MDGEITRQKILLHALEYGLCEKWEREARILRLKTFYDEAKALSRAADELRDLIINTRKA